MFGIAKSWSNPGSTLPRRSLCCRNSAPTAGKHQGAAHRVQHSLHSSGRRWSQRWCRGCWGNTREPCRAPLLRWLSPITAHPGTLCTATHVEVLLSKAISEGESASSPEISHVVN